MLSKKYRLSYLPLFYEELDEKITYIARELKNPKATIQLLTKLEEGEQSVREKGWLTADEVETALGL